MLLESQGRAGSSSAKAANSSAGSRCRRAKRPRNRGPWTPGSSHATRSRMPAAQPATALGASSPSRCQWAPCAAPSGLASKPRSSADSRSAMAPFPGYGASARLSGQNPSSTVPPPVASEDAEPPHCRQATLQSGAVPAPSETGRQGGAAPPLRPRRRRPLRPPLEPSASRHRHLKGYRRQCREHQPGGPEETCPRARRLSAPSAQALSGNPRRTRAPGWVRRAGAGGRAWSTRSRLTSATAMAPVPWRLRQPRRRPRCHRLASARHRLRSRAPRRTRAGAAAIRPKPSRTAAWRLARAGSACKAASWSASS
mmetsp:Transcript_49896/g.139658  ORF Transcript_49896/g.139658 Transcript_49896/m.139658 type:complete len:312 (+) Transcript_49896:473-1408(+)